MSFALRVAVMVLFLLRHSLADTLIRGGLLNWDVFQVLCREEEEGGGG